jgi:glycosyltransferase involved in cell wall biosynthesis
MHVALVTHSVIRGDGQGRMNYEITRHCLSAGIRVSLIAERVAPELVAAGAIWISVRPPFRRPHLLKAKCFAAMADRAVAALGDKVNVVVGNGFSLRRRHELNISSFVHSAYRQVATGDWGRGLTALYRRGYSWCNAGWERQAYEAAKAVVATSARVRKELLDLGVPAGRMHLVRYGVDLKEFRPGSESRTELGLPPSVPLALFAGDIRTRRKNLETVLQSLADTPDLHLAVVGNTVGSPYPAFANKLGVHDRVHFLGFRSDIAQVMRACDLFVFPSLYEPFGLVILEALASGLPVVTSSTTGASEIMSDECGVVVDNPTDVPALAAAIRRITDDADTRKKMSIAARSTAEQHSWDAMTVEYERVFRKMGQ